jgi:hypothetical protein
MKKNMFDLHYLTFWGIIIIAIGTIFGTILIQRGNVLKSKESSNKLQEQLKKQDTKIEILSTSNIQIGMQNEHLTKLNEQQNEVLEAQNILLKEHRVSLKEQTDFLNNTERNNALFDYRQYFTIVESYNAEVFLNFAKDNIMQLSNSEISTLEEKSKDAIYHISQSKFVSLHRPLYSLWMERGYRIYIFLENILKLQNETTILEENGLKTKVDHKFKSDKFDYFATFLKENNRKITNEVQSIAEKNNLASDNKTFLQDKKK